MKTAIITLAAPPFDYESFWWWAMQTKKLQVSVPFDLIAPSGKHQFRQETGANGTAHCLNIFVEEKETWSERERIEFTIKSHLYLSKLHRKQPYDRLIVTDCDGAEPMIVSNLSTMAPVWVRTPAVVSSRRGELGYAQLELAEREFCLENWIEMEKLGWPPNPETAHSVFSHLLSE